jgi:hypothetical protein
MIQYGPIKTVGLQIASPGMKVNKNIEENENLGVQESGISL